MITKIFINRAIGFTSVSSLLIGTFLLFASPSLALSGGDSNTVSTPSRRKPGASRFDSSALSEVSSPSRRKPGSTREAGLASPLRRKPGSTREEVIVSPLRRKPGSTRSDIALLLQDQKSKQGSYHCNSDIYQLTALIPENLQLKTTQATPTLYFKMPSLPTPTEMEFVLQDEQRQVVYAATLRGNPQAGIMALTLPPSQELQVNQNYRWYLSVICDANRRERDLVVEGLIQRVELDATTRQSLSHASRQEQIRLYQAQGLWQDALQTVVTAYQESHEAALIPVWQSLLIEINLGGLEDAMTKKSFFALDLQPLSLNVPAPINSD